MIQRGAVCVIKNLKIYEEWERSVHERVKAEPVWGFLGYRKALFLYDVAWEDCESLLKDKRGQEITRQKHRRS